MTPFHYLPEQHYFKDFKIHPRNLAIIGIFQVSWVSRVQYSRRFLNLFISQLASICRDPNQHSFKDIKLHPQNLALIGIFQVSREQYEFLKFIY